jgi:hypothetical protein
MVRSISLGFTMSPRLRASPRHGGADYRFFGMRKGWSDLPLSEFTMNAAAPGGAPPRRIRKKFFYSVENLFHVV